MHFQRTRTLAAVVVTAATAATWGFADPARAVNVGNNPGGPSAMLVVNSGPFGGTPSFLLVENVTHDPAAGNRITVTPPVDRSGGRLLNTDVAPAAAGALGAAAGTGGSAFIVNIATFCSLPSSNTRKSAAVRSRTGCPALL